MTTRRPSDRRRRARGGAAWPVWGKGRAVRPAVCPCLPGQRASPRTRPRGSGMRLGARHREVLADLHDDLLPVGRHDVGLVDTVGVCLDPLDRRVRVLGQRRLGDLRGGVPGQQLLVAALWLRRVTASPGAAATRAAGNALLVVGRRGGGAAGVGRGVGGQGAGEDTARHQAPTDESSRAPPRALADPLPVTRLLLFHLVRHVYPPVLGRPPVGRPKNTLRDDALTKLWTDWVFAQSERLVGAQKDQCLDRAVPTPLEGCRGGVAVEVDRPAAV